MPIRRRPGPSLDPAALLCRNCHTPCSTAINGLCPLCYSYLRDHRKHRPTYKKRDLETNLEYCEGIGVELKRMRKEFRGDNELIRLVESAEFALVQLGKATKERIKEAK